ncbi:MAG: hypothetical protein A3F78_05275 [Burkholderiales bacterium RIFCSPLOWO2_12_FULL_61_40]|nr:MAG: hypothetical protein A3F78_05275 [Burkholderiales bacterium RIFCSPLOWO2_12_FULL_61_40]
MASFTGRVFGPGLAGTGEVAQAQWQHGQLRLQTPSLSLDMGVNPHITGGGFNAEQLRVSWQAPEGEFVFFVDAGAAQAAFVADLPPQWRAQLAGAQRSQSRVRARWRWGIAALVLCLSVPLAALVALVVRSDAVAAWVVQWVPPAYEAKLGDLVLVQTQAQMRLIDSGPAVEALRQMGEKLVPHSPYRYRWLLADHPDVNAFAAPGGVVVVFSGLLMAADTPEEVAAVLAHEVAHAELRHGLQGVVKSLGLQAGAVLLGDATGVAVPGLLSHLLERQFSREAETAADAEGLRRLVAARIDPANMVVFMKKLAAKEKGVELPQWLSTHPAPEDRAARLQAQVSTLPGPWQPLAIDWAAVQRSLPRQP